MGKCTATDYYIEQFTDRNNLRARDRGSYDCDRCDQYITKGCGGIAKGKQNRSVSAEGLLSFKPTLVLANEGDVANAVIQQIRAAGVKFIAVKPDYSAAGALRYIQEVANGVGEPASGKALVSRTKISLDRTLELVKRKIKEKLFPKCCFCMHAEQEQ
ncbi:hypothetical protein KUH03_00235 [Sphingobacterium sp. E70]|uniref:ABC transporter substrate-binding protein n=1 Tax=Sphingobacterium sp. E70 TaxID=2853439 RepID=UPI00211BE273|nr:hypothetical protein [Sphingobacterium sp. E70]ULT25491.1 hypothetical protein KUH03_00235 [Sphingobacterium sp. E70]